MVNVISAAPNRPVGSTGRSVGFLTLALLVGALAMPQAARAQAGECTFADTPVNANTASAIMQELGEKLVPTAADTADVLGRAWASITPDFEAEPAHPFSLLLGAQILIGLNRFDEALAGLERFDAVASEACLPTGGQVRQMGFSVLANSGTDQYREGDMEGAVASWQMAVSFTKHMGVQGNVAMTQANLGDVDGAIVSYQQLLADHQAEGGDALAQYVRNLGGLLIATERVEEAVATYEEFADAFGENATANMGYAEALRAAGREAEADEIMGGLSATEGVTADDLIRVGEAFYQSGDFEAAREQFQSAREVTRFHKLAMENLVITALQMVDTSAAELADTLTSWYPYDEAVISIGKSMADLTRNSARIQELEARAAAAPVTFPQRQGVQLLGSADNGYIVRGDARAGTAGSVELQFEFFDSSGEVVHVELITIEAPAGETAPFSHEFRFDQELAGFRYGEVRG